MSEQTHFPNRCRKRKGEGWGGGGESLSGTLYETTPCQTLVPLTHVHSNKRKKRRKEKLLYMQCLYKEIPHINTKVGFSSILLTHFLQVIVEFSVPVERILVFSVLVNFTSGLLSLGFHFTFGKDCRKESKRAIVMGKNHLCTLLTEHFFLAGFSVCTNSFMSLACKPTTWNTREANEFVHAEKLARKKCSVSRVSSLCQMNSSSDFCNMKHNEKDWHGMWFFCTQSRFATKSFCYTQSSALQRILLPLEVDLQQLHQDDFLRKWLCSKTTSQLNGQYPAQLLS